MKATLILCQDHARKAGLAESLYQPSAGQPRPAIYVTFIPDTEYSIKATDTCHIPGGNHEGILTAYHLVTITDRGPTPLTSNRN